MATLEVFLAYSHADGVLKDELRKHLSMLQRDGLIDLWHDREIRAGASWEREIDERVRSAPVVLMLVSADFIASEYCWTVEARIALERARDRQALVVPIILRPCDWKSAPFAVLQALPSDARPITSWVDRDEAFTNVALDLRAAILSARLAAVPPPAAAVSQSYLGPAVAETTRGMGHSGVRGIGRFPVNVEGILRNIGRMRTPRRNVTEAEALDGVSGPLPDNREALNLAFSEGLVETHTGFLSLTRRGAEFLAALDAGDALVRWDLEQQMLSVEAPDYAKVDETTETIQDVPVVGCASHTQTGFVPPSPASVASLRLPPGYGKELSLYGSAGGALAPRDWYCLSHAGSGGASLTVAPTPLEWGVDTHLDEFVLCAYFSGNTGGRHQVIQVGAPLFPELATVASTYLVDYPDMQGKVRTQPRLGETVTRLLPGVVRVVNDAYCEGAGTIVAGVRPNGFPVHSVAVLGPYHGVTGEPDLQIIAVRVRDERAHLTEVLLRHFRHTRQPS